MNIDDTSLLSLYAASFHVFENVAKPSLPLSRSCCRNAQAVLNVPLVLIVQPRKHRKLPTTSVWNGRNCLCHGSTKIRLRRSYTCFCGDPDLLVWGKRNYIWTKKGIKVLFFAERPQKERPGCVSPAGSGRRLRVDTVGINRRGWARRMDFFSPCLTCYCQLLGDGGGQIWVTRVTVSRCYYNIHGEHHSRSGLTGRRQTRLWGHTGKHTPV